MKAKVLVVDDEPKIVELLRLYLEKDGYQALPAGSGKVALDLLKREHPSLIILDLNLPEMDGLEVCRRIRSESTVPIIMLTARVEDVDRILGLEMGADDYVTKPFSPREVVARVRAVLRRSLVQEPQSQERLTFHDLGIDPLRHQASIGSRVLDLTPTEFQLLWVLAKEPGRVFSRLQLLDRVWGETYEGYERNIDAHIKNLRRKLEKDPQEPRYVLTVFGIGYKFADQSHE